jgi:hypothetical protein
MKVIKHSTIKEFRIGTPPAARPAPVKGTIYGWRSEFKPGNIVLDEERRIWMAKDEPHETEIHGPDKGEE